MNVFNCIPVRKIRYRNTKEGKIVAITAEQLSYFFFFLYFRIIEPGSGNR